MFLKEIFNQENLDKEELFGVFVDKDSMALSFSTTPPSNLKMLGLVLVLDEENSIDTDLIDVIINYKLTNLPVILEVPANLIVQNLVKCKELIQLSSNLDVSLSILPPGHSLVDSSVTENDYVNIISELTDLIIEKPNFDKQVLPIANFMEYLMVEKILGENSAVVKNFKPTDPYIVDNFSSVLSVDASDAFKSVVRNKLYDFYGGQENFDVVADAIFQSIQNKSEEIYKESVQRSIQQHYANQASQNELTNQGNLEK